MEVEQKNQIEQKNQNLKLLSVGLKQISSNEQKMLEEMANAKAATESIIKTILLNHQNNLPQSLSYDEAMKAIQKNWNTIFATARHTEQILLEAVKSLESMR